MKELSRLLESAQRRQVCIFRDLCAVLKLFSLMAGMFASGLRKLPLLNLTVVNSRIKKGYCHCEDEVEHLIEGVPCDDQSQHRVAGLVHPIQITVRSVFTHEQHDHGVAVERWDREKVKCAEEQVQNEQNAQSGSGKSWLGGIRRCCHARVVDKMRRLKIP